MHVQLPYQVTLIQLPQGNEPGLVHVELPIASSDIQLLLPPALRDWINEFGTALELQILNTNLLDGINLTGDGAFLKLLASVDRRSPLEFVMRAAGEQVKVRIVWKP